MVYSRIDFFRLFENDLSGQIPIVVENYSLKKKFGEHGNTI